MTGFLVAFWAAPELTLGRLVLNVAATIYIFTAVFRFEEPDLCDQFGDEYEKYRDEVPSLCPFAIFSSKSSKKEA